MIGEFGVEKKGKKGDGAGGVKTECVRVRGLERCRDERTDEGQQEVPQADESEVDDDDDEMIWWSWDGKLVGFSGW